MTEVECLTALGIVFAAMILLATGAIPLVAVEVILLPVAQIAGFRNMTAVE
jgi:hypothetical protein